MQHATFLLVESSSGLSAKIAVNGVEFLVISFFPQDGLAIRTPGIQKGTVHTQYTIIIVALNFDSLIGCV